MSSLPLATKETPARLATREFPSSDSEHRVATLGVRVQSLKHSFGHGELAKQVLFDNCLDVTRGEIVIMTGPSGSGKTTLLTLIGGLRTIQQGSVQIMGREMSGLGPQELVDVRRDIGFIFQAHNLFPSLTAFQNVRMSLELHGIGADEMRERAEEMLKLLGLGHRIHYKPEALSGGQRQRVAIARALASRPSLILADEPTAALDKQSGRDVVDLLKKCAQEQKTTILMVTHDNRILDAADRIVNMVDGHIISDVVVGAVVVVTEFLRHCPLFRELTPGTLASVADKVAIEQHPAGTVIVRQGDPGDKFYIIRKGKATVSVRDDQGSHAKATLKERDFFGEAALLTGAPRNATVTADEPIELYVLGKDDFAAVIEASASFNEQLRKGLFQRQ
jgi:putative ABC transport system ATP-binding protein